MSDNEYKLYRAFIGQCNTFVEFGTGGSTVLAASCVKQQIFAVDSSQEWLGSVEQACLDKSVQPKLLFADIGATREWGYPSDPSTRSRWPTYHETIWTIEAVRDADLFMVDGRFRVACFAQVVLHCRPDALICFHDFASRKHYHGVYDLAREIASAEDLSVFIPKPDAKAQAMMLLEKHRFDPA
ncbi:hypothetical protein M2323_002086 [Rhodoblastus acidophilus]|uniref:hypothetical protein n=1 Tax=Rhodoblastus acidophilus TaxID=1074 RepID=UPI0022247E55|nr:hypothetical protein [Rhodoblastus acidophilus]MCW2284365.1 hypothetical protein [Rhodoblastus acidophilus]MCW2333157.1 hypothetical protein [Rhodoblastus acidophilus]